MKLLQDTECIAKDFTILVLLDVPHLVAPNERAAASAFQIWQEGHGQVTFSARGHPEAELGSDLLHLPDVIFSFEPIHLWGSHGHLELMK